MLATFDFLAAEGPPGSDGTDDDEDDDVVMGAPSVDEMRPPCTQDPEGESGGILWDIQGSSLKVAHRFRLMDALPQERSASENWRG